MTTVLRVENLWKQYRLGVIGHGYLFRDLQSWWARVRGEDDPNRKINFSSDDTPVAQDRIWALQDLSLEVKPGEVLGIIGRNGAGKSTLLKIISRVTAPTRGEIKIKGRVASLLEVGTGFHPELTGRENIFLNGAILGMTIREIQGKFDSIVDFAGVEKFVDTPVKRYSSGMHVRLAFSVAAHLEAEILVVDEVLAVGDAGFQKKCLAKMGEVTGAGRTVLFVSHNMGAISSLCSRAILLERGRLARTGGANAVVAAYLAATSDTGPGENGFASLENHPGRFKSWLSGKIRFEHCFLTDEFGHRTGYLTVGRPGNITLGFKVRNSVAPANLVFVAVVENSRGDRITYLSSELAGARFDDLPAEGEVTCTIPRVPLVPGRYSLTLACREGPEWLDSVYQAMSFEVVGAEFYSTGQLPPADGGGDFLLDSQWSGPSERRLESRS
jgi:lipopolysaccharide transport system ATP-binding protein